MKQSKNQNQQRPRDAEGRFESKQQGQGSHAKGSSMDRPRDAEGRFESKKK